LDGILNIDKPGGRTSFSIVAEVKRLCHERHVGHAGTLDPLATGVLPILLGKATRVAEYLLDLKKTYLAEVEFGSQTDTGDAEGNVIFRGDTSPLSRDQIDLVLPEFRGQIRQTPPMFSALKYHGRPLYKYAREGTIIERKDRTVEIYSLELLDWSSPIGAFQISCSHGTYIRTLGEDIGKALGCGAHLKTLVRTEYGPFSVKDAVSLEVLQNAVNQGTVLSLLHPPDSVMQHFPTLKADQALSEDIRHGKSIKYEIIEASAGNHCRAYNLDGSFLGVLRFNSEKGEWQPRKIFVK
jgi:tRNA pseudouridine55 synthase